MYLENFELKIVRIIIEIPSFLQSSRIKFVAPVTDDPRDSHYVKHRLAAFNEAPVKMSISLIEIARSR